jgi:Transcriptional Coactivator p15 (PC4)
MLDSTSPMHISYVLQKGESKERQGKVLMTNTGEKYIDLGKKKRAAVREFKGAVFLDIREYYGADDQEKPGKKGISLTLEQVGQSPFLRLNKTSSIFAVESSL